MSSEFLTISSLFSNKEISKKSAKALKMYIKANKRRTKGAVLYKEILAKINDLLDIKLDKILKNTWGSAKDLQATLKLSNESPDKIFYASLAKHSVTSTHSPSIQIIVAEKKIFEFEFDINLGLQLDDVVLRILSGRIQGIKSGFVSAVGEIEFENITLLEIESKSFTLRKSPGAG